MISFNFNPFPVLQTERLVLDRIKNEDAEALFDLRKNAEAMRYLDRDMPKDIREIYRMIEQMNEGAEKNENIGWGIFLKENKKFIGTMGYYRSDRPNHRSEIGYMLSPAYWKKGFISEAMRVSIDYGFKEMNLHSIEANVNPANIASIKTLLKFGFVKEAYFRENFYFNGKFLDTEIYSLLKNTGN